MSEHQTSLVITSKMAKKKKAPKNYSYPQFQSAANLKPNSIQTIGVVQTSVPNDYPDPGVRYAGYYKRILPNGQYEIKPQLPFRIVMTAGVPSTGVYTRNPAYIQNMKLVNNSSELGGFFISIPTDNLGVSPMLNSTLDNLTGESFITFEFPIQCPIGFYLANNLTGAQAVYLYGWEEPR